MKLLTGAAFAVVLISSDAIAQQPPPLPPQPPSVVTTGEGLIEVAPDRAWITVTAESRAKNARDAQRRNTEVMSGVVSKLRAERIAAEAIRTVGYDLQQEWDFVNNQRVLRGYVARNSVEVRVDDINQVGDLLETAVASGATAVGGVRFDLKDRQKLERDALRLAVADAQARAEAAAAGAGRAIAGVQRIDVVPTPPPPVPFARVALQRAEQGGTPDAPPIAAGQIEIRAQVTLTSLLK